jgi:RecB family endonuclease NucS
MTEKELVWHFAQHQLENLQQELDLQHNLRVYALEFPVIHNENDKGYADLVLELENSNSIKENILFILEAKINKVSHSALDQLNSYIDYIKKKLYRNKAFGLLLAPEFSIYTIEQAKIMNIGCIQYDKNNNIRLIF